MVREELTNTPTEGMTLTTQLCLYYYCCNLSGGVALIVWFTMNGMCVKNKNTCMWREQAIIEWSRQVISIVACCHGAKLCAHATRDFRSQQNGAVTRMWKSCGVQPSPKERAICAVRCKKEGMLLQPLRWFCVDCVIHHGCAWRTTPYIYVAQKNNNRVVMACELYCCLLPQCEALHICHSGYSIATLVETVDTVRISVVPDPDFWSPIRKIYEIFLDPEPDWISFLLKPDPDYPKRLEHF